MLDWSGLFAGVIEESEKSKSKLLETPVLAEETGTQVVSTPDSGPVPIVNSDQGNAPRPIPRSAPAGTTVQQHSTQGGLKDDQSMSHLGHVTDRDSILNEVS